MSIIAFFLVFTSIDHSMTYDIFCFSLALRRKEFVTCHRFDCWLIYTKDEASYPAGNKVRQEEPVRNQ